MDLDLPHQLIEVRVGARQCVQCSCVHGTKMIVCTGAGALAQSCGHRQRTRDVQDMVRVLYRSSVVPASFAFQPRHAEWGHMHCSSEHGLAWTTAPDACLASGVKL